MEKTACSLSVFFVEAWNFLNVDLVEDCFAFNIEAMKQLHQNIII